MLKNGRTNDDARRSLANACRSASISASARWYSPIATYLPPALALAFALALAPMLLAPMWLCVVVVALSCAADELRCVNGSSRRDRAGDCRRDGDCADFCAGRDRFEADGVRGLVNERADCECDNAPTLRESPSATRPSRLKSLPRRVSMASESTSVSAAAGASSSWPPKSRSTCTCGRG